MYSKIYSSQVLGIEGAQVDLEIYITGGLPSFRIIGMADKVVREASERVKAAIKSSGYKLPSSKVRINLTPSEIPKKGTGLDLPIALGIVIAMSNRKVHKKIHAFGEVSMNGELQNSAGLFQFLETVERDPNPEKSIIVPHIDRRVHKFFSHLKIHTVANLKEAVSVILEPNQTPQTCYIEEQFNRMSVEHTNLGSIKGQNEAKKALLISAAGKHHIMISGPIGIGKTLLAQSLYSILPKPTTSEQKEICKITNAHSEVSTERPLREISTTVTTRELFGNHQSPISEIIKSNNGILLMDEISEMPMSLINKLRIPLEKAHTEFTIHNKKSWVPNRFILCATRNLCPCGKTGEKDSKCKCSEYEIIKYQKRIPEAVLNRIDLNTYIYSSNIEMRETNKTLNYLDIATTARAIQSRRYKNETYKTNSEIPYKDLDKYCRLDFKATDTLNLAMRKFALNGRDYVKIVRVARTIADITQSDNVSTDHILEALSYRITQPE